MKIEMRLDLSTVIYATNSGAARISTHDSPTIFLDITFAKRIYRQAWPTGQRAQWSLHEWRHHQELYRAMMYLTSHGFVEFHPDEGQSLFVELIAVDHRHQRQGHGRALMHAVIKHGLSLQLRRIILVTTRDVKSFYTSLGFEHYRDIPDEPSPADPQPRVA